jgi:hypothetical protein
MMIALNTSLITTYAGHALGKNAELALSRLTTRSLLQQEFAIETLTLLIINGQEIIKVAIIATLVLIMLRN